MAPQLATACQEMGFEPPPADADDFQILTRELLKGYIRVLEACSDRLVGRPQGHDLETIFKDLGLNGQGNGNGNGDGTASQLTAPLKVEPDTPAPSKTTNITMKELVAEFQRQKVEAGKWRETTVRNHAPKLNALNQVLGEGTAVASITVDQLREYAKILEGLPPIFFLKGYGDLSGVSSSELAGKHDQTLDITTRREYLNIARSVFQYALDNEYLEKNPVIPGLIPPKKSNPRDQRSPFSPADLNVIFNPKTFIPWSAKSSARYWVPKLALWTGGRLEELSNLNVSDVLEVDTDEGKLVIHFQNIAVALIVLFLAVNASASELSYTCEVLGVYDLSESGILELSSFEKTMKGGSFTVSRLTGLIMGEVLSTSLSKSTQVLNRGSTKNSFKTIANFSQYVQLLEIQEFRKGPAKPFVAVSMGGAGVVTGVCK